MTARGLIQAGRPVPCAGCLRFELTPFAWRDLAAALRADPGLDFIGLWADTAQVHALFAAATPTIASVPVESGLYGALSAARPGAALFERAVADLWGHQAADAADARPWLDHGTWPTLRPMAERPAPNAGLSETPEMHEAPHGSDTLALGPLPPNLVDAPMHWRVAVARNTVVQLEARGGYGHRGALAALRGPASEAARVAARIAGTATVAHSTAFARAVEAALATAVPPRAAALRTLLGAVERVAVALHDIAATAAALGQPQPSLALARERLLEACGTALNHRLLMDAVRPGGVAPDLKPGTAGILDEALDAVPAPRVPWPGGLGVLPVAAALRWDVPGPAGRASGRLDPATPGGTVDGTGDLRTRMDGRAAALAADVTLARETLAILPDGPTTTPLPSGTAEGLGFAKGPQGRVWHWVRLEGGIVTASFAIDPAWLLLPAFERAGQGADPTLLPAIAASFGLHPAGMDL